MIERFAPHLGFDVDAEHVTPVSHNHRQPGPHEIDDRQDDRGEDDAAPVLARQEGVDKVSHSHWEAELEQPGNNCAGEIEQEESLPGAVIGVEVEEELHRVVVGPG